MIRYVGLDVHKQWTQVAWHFPDGSIQRERIATQPGMLKAFAQRLGSGDVVALESTTNALAIARLLRSRAGEVLVSNPLRTRLIAESKIKTDKVDADVLAQLARSGFLPTVWQPPVELEVLRRRSAYQAALTRQITQVKNRLHSVLHRHLVEAPVAELFSQAGRGFLGQVELPLDERAQVDLDLELLEQLEAARSQARQVLARHALVSPQAQLLMTIPGIDYPTAIGLVAAIGPVERFREPRKLTSYFGLAPSVHQSADKCYSGPISKRGRAHARWLLVEAAHCAVRSPGPLRAFFLRLKKRKGTNVAVVAAARKLLVIIHHMLSSGEPYRYAPVYTTHVKLARLEYLATGVPKKGGVPKGTKRSASYGSGLRTRTLRSRQDRIRLLEAEQQYNSFIKEREVSRKSRNSC